MLLGKNRPDGASKKYEKKCQFPDCNKTFEGYGASKYCEEHSTPEAKKIIRDMNREKRKENEYNFDVSNCTIKHNYIKKTPFQMECPCGREFTIDLYPNVEKYPRFCELHRNPFKRERLIKKLTQENKLKEIQTEFEVYDAC